MADAARSDSVTFRRILGGLLLIGIVVIGLTIVRRIDALSDRVGVVIDAAAGTIRVAGTDRGTQRVQWIAEPSVEHLVPVPAGTPAGEGWESAAALLLPGWKVIEVERPTLTKQSSGSGRGKRQVQAVRALLVLEGPEGRREPAVGIGTAVVREGDSAATSARTIVQLIDADGRPLRCDAEPLFHDRPATLLDRVRGSPPHVVRFGLAEIPEKTPGSEPERSEAPAPVGEPGRLRPVPLEGEEAIEAIEKLRENRPKRGEIPKPPPAPPAEPQPAPPP
jgi:hypothetical protein